MIGIITFADGWLFLLLFLLLLLLLESNRITSSLATCYRQLPATSRVTRLQAQHKVAETAGTTLILRVCSVLLYFLLLYSADLRSTLRRRDQTLLPNPRITPLLSRGPEVGRLYYYRPAGT